MFDLVRKNRERVWFKVLIVLVLLPVMIFGAAACGSEPDTSAYDDWWLWYWLLSVISRNSYSTSSNSCTTNVSGCISYYYSCSASSSCYSSYTSCVNSGTCRSVSEGTVSETDAVELTAEQQKMVDDYVDPLHTPKIK